MFLHDITIAGLTSTGATQYEKATIVSDHETGPAMLAEAIARGFFVAPMRGTIEGAPAAAALIPYHRLFYAWDRLGRDVSSTNE